MRVPAAALLATVAFALAGCSAAAPAPVPLPAPAPTSASEPTTAAPLDAGTLASCLRAGVPGAEVSTVDAPPKGVAAVAVDVARPDLPKGINRITVVAFPTDGDADGFRSGAGAFVSGTGGSAETVGSAVVMSTHAGDDAAVAAAKTCAAGS